MRLGWTFKSRAWWQVVLAIVVPLVGILLLIVIPGCYHQFIAK